MENSEIRENLDLLNFAQAVDLVSGHNELVYVENQGGEGPGIPDETFQTVKSALNLKTGSELDEPTNELAKNIIKPTHNPGGSPGGS